MADKADIKREVAKLRQHARDINALARWLSENGEKLHEMPYAYPRLSVTLRCNENDAEGELDVDKSKRLISKTARIMGNATKEFSYDNLNVTKEFGDTVTFQATVSREAVCTKKVIKKEYVKYSSDGYWNEEVEWDCHTPSILALSDKE